MNILQLARGIFIYGVGSVLSKIISFFLLPLYTNYLTPAEYGISSILGIVSMIITSVFCFGFGTSIGMIYFDVEGKKEKSEIISSAFAILVLVSILIII